MSISRAFCHGCEVRSILKEKVVMRFVIWYNAYILSKRGTKMSNEKNNQAEFMETLRSVAEIVRTTAEPMGKEEIASYFTDMNLSEEQKEMVYQYLMTPHTDEQEAESEENEEEKEEEKENRDSSETETDHASEDGEESDFPATDLFQMYLDELEEVKQLDDEEEKELYEKLAAGDESVISPLAENWLVRVLELAQEQVMNDDHLEDVIQEGNMSVFLTLSSLCGEGKKENYEEIISNAALEAMNSYLVEELSDEMAMKSKKTEGDK